MKSDFNLFIREAAGLVLQDMADFESLYLGQLSEDIPDIDPVLGKLRGIRGKRLRPLMMFLCQGMSGSSHPARIRMALILELLHLISIIHDDVVDGSDLRRGSETLNVSEGNQIAVLTGDFLMAKVLSLSLEAGDEVIRKVSDCVRIMTRGELRHAVFSRGRWISAQECLDNIGEKTASLFQLAFEFGGMPGTINSSAGGRLRRAGYAFGMAYQIRDDILDFIGVNSDMGKSPGQDLKNGFLTLPLIHALESGGGNARLRMEEIIRSGSARDAEWLRSYVLDHGGVEKSQEQAARFADQTLAEIRTFPDSPFRTALERLTLDGLVRSA
ncbi:polyprenyl synthetase family protein [bacterium]|nr:polyprenyl synthetase family protein [bacterium]